MSARLPAATTAADGPGDPFKSERLPGLDGLRGIAAWCVVFYHVTMSPGFPNAPGVARVLSRIGLQAVPLFFVLSGFLITHLLLAEEEKYGRLSLRLFYARRALRILPAALVYLLVLALLTPLLGLTVRMGDIAAAAFFYRNFYYGGWAAWAHQLPDGFAYTGHYWSLSVEEHFYAFWPLLLVALRRSWRRPLVIALLALIPLWRIINLKVYSFGGMNYWRTDLVLDYLLAGALLALLFHHAPARAWLRRFAHPWVALPAVVGLFGPSAREGFDPHGMLMKLAFFLEISVRAASLCVLLAVFVQGAGGWFQRVLDSRLLVWCGKISFSLYLWQQLFNLHELPCSWMGCFPANLLGALLAAVASCYLIEQPFLKLRTRFHPQRNAPAAGS